MARRYKIYVFGALFFKLLKYIGKALICYGFTVTAVRNAVILAKNAVKVTARKKTPCPTRFCRLCTVLPKNAKQPLQRAAAKAFCKSLLNFRFRLALRYTLSGTGCISFVGFSVLGLISHILRRALSSS